MFNATLNELRHVACVCNSYQTTYISYTSCLNCGVKVFFITSVLMTVFFITSLVQGGNRYTSTCGSGKPTYVCITQPITQCY